MPTFDPDDKHRLSIRQAVFDELGAQRATPREGLEGLALNFPSPKQVSCITLERVGLTSTLERPMALDVKMSRLLRGGGGSTLCLGWAGGHVQLQQAQS